MIPQQIAPLHICPTTYYRCGVASDDKETESVIALVEMEDEELYKLKLNFWYFPNRTDPQLNIDFGFLACEFKGQKYIVEISDLHLVTQEVFLSWAGGDNLILLKSSDFDFFTDKQD